MRNGMLGAQVNRLGALAVVFSAGVVSAGDDAVFDPDFGLEFITIGDPGNDPVGAYKIPIGIVDDEYRIMRTQFNSGQYMDYFNVFLSADPDEFWSLYPSGDSSLVDNGPGFPLELQRSLAYPRRTPVGMDFVQAAMLCNWLHNGQSDDRESLMNGAYEVLFTYPHFHVDQASRHPDARYWIPSYDELLKATFYDPDKEGQGPGWWSYPHTSNEPPISGFPGEGHIPRDISVAELAAVYGGSVRLQTVPLEVYTDVQSPWGLLDTLGGHPEWSETLDVDRPLFRFERHSNNTTTGWGTDYILSRWNSHPQSSIGLRIASAVLHPADLNEDWSVNFFDVSFFLRRYFEGDLSVDFNEDNQLDINDVWVFLELMGQ